MTCNYRDKQESLEQIRQKLHGQMQQKIDDEDVRIARATEEGEAKRAKEEALREEKIRKAHNEMAAHRHEQVCTLVRMIRYLNSLSLST